MKTFTNILGWIGYGLVAGVAALGVGLIATMFADACLASPMTCNIMGYMTMAGAWLFIMATRRIETGIVCKGLADVAAQWLWLMIVLS
jgi:hypothetical protein